MGTNLNTCIIEQAQEVKRGKVNALFPINNHFVAWRAVKEKHGYWQLVGAQHI